MGNRTQEIKQESLFCLSVIDLVKEISMVKTTIKIRLKKMKEKFCLKTTLKWLPTTGLFIGVEYQLGHRPGFRLLILHFFSSFVCFFF